MPATITPSRSRATAAAHSHPEASDRTPRRWAINYDLRDRLVAYQQAEGITNIALGKRLGYPDGTAWSKYLNDNMDRDPSDLEKRAQDLLSASARRRLYTGVVIETNVVQKVAMFIDRCREIGKPGVCTGEAGIGKTVGIHAYLQANPTAVGIKANAIQNDARGVIGLLWAVAGSSAYSNEPRYGRLVSRFKGSRVPIIIDGAQRLGAGGRAVLYDFFDDTGCPLVLVGNPTIYSQVARVDQDHSRTHLACEVELKNQARVVKAIVAQHLDDPDSVLDLALQVVARPYGGHLRALENLLTATRVLMELPANAASPRSSFEKALAASVVHRDLAS